MYHCASKLILLRCAPSARFFLSQRPFLYMACHCHLISPPHVEFLSSSRALQVYSGAPDAELFGSRRPFWSPAACRFLSDATAGFLWQALPPLGAIIAAFRTIAGFADWWGGYSFGPRILQFALPAVALLALLLVHAASLRGGRERIAILALCGAIAGWEGFVHISGMNIVAAGSPGTPDRSM